MGVIGRVLWVEARSGWLRGKSDRVRVRTRFS